ncbi:hypothetical protein RHMOL_Rhmol12G0063500 [Rhododendron molle]|uniref:Uncharacterized protein n=4 Tax=Rhododendron molle TaxID=49168 RepID=A0ACC0LF82_RHOML|nr:hypothetical protein RHMOL_Rhmol12G0063500 [Rhododendron molle]KAI8527286.1 hypothetical protein RHMOL_Rhmol12G0063500 [Rhododendron molle]KAI8527290.1 hypothetical protein RHMOL_Rhmol12G0063500 [Rhododendron molle]KAI8527291.1 hypothetical protein RHMOL_Rhmol12G0063500 [Rhododendron molle]
MEQDGGISKIRGGGGMYGHGRFDSVLRILSVIFSALILPFSFLVLGGCRARSIIGSWKTEALIVVGPVQVHVFEHRFGSGREPEDVEGGGDCGAVEVSPTAGRKKPSPSTRRLLIASGRRLSGGIRVLLAGLDLASKKQMESITAGISKEQAGFASYFANSDDAHYIVHLPVLTLISKAAISGRLSDASSQKSNKEDSKISGKPAKYSVLEAGLKPEKPTSASPVISVHGNKWTDGSVPLDAVSARIGKLGKAAISRRLCDARSQKSNREYSEICRKPAKSSVMDAGLEPEKLTSASPVISVHEK